MPGPIGLVGGMSWESTAVYYRLINEGVRDRRGGLHSADILLRSVDFAPVAAMQSAGDWEAAGALLAEAVAGLERAGAACVLLCTNTMHRLAPAIEARLSVPLLHLADVTAAEIARLDVRRPLLLATRFTMEQDFYRARLEAKSGCRVMVPDADERAMVHQVIYEELCCGIVSDASRRRYLAVIDRAAAEGADAVILGCTEIGLLLAQEHHALPMLDTTRLHADAAVRFALGEPARIGAAA